MYARETIPLCLCVYCVALLVQEKSSASDIYEHVRDGGADYDAQTMDAATESQGQMMQMTELDNVSDDDGDADKPDVPPDIEKDIVQVIIVQCINSSCKLNKLHCVY